MALQRSEMANSLDKNMQLTRQQLQQQQLVQYSELSPPQAMRVAVPTTTGVMAHTYPHILYLTLSCLILPYPTLPNRTLLTFLFSSLSK